MNDKNTAGLLHEALQDLIGLHRQLLDVVKQEGEALSQADVKNTFEATSSKEALVHWIHQSEQSRQVIAFTLAQELNLENPSLKEIIANIQLSDASVSQQLQTDLSALIVLVERIQSQNRINAKIVERSLENVDAMRKNIFGEVTSENKTYNQYGQKNQASVSSTGPRLISKEV